MDVVPQRTARYLTATVQVRSYLLCSWVICLFVCLFWGLVVVGLLFVAVVLFCFYSFFYLFFIGVGVSNIACVDEWAGCGHRRTLRAFRADGTGKPFHWFVI